MAILLWLAGIAGFAVVLVVAVAMRPDVPRSELIKRWSEPGSRFIPLPGGDEAHVVISGPEDGPALILLHGFGSSTHAWAKWRPLLDDRYRVIALDLHLHGLTKSASGAALSQASQVALVLATADALGVERFIVGGNSMGGGISWRTALAAPLRVRGMVLVDAAGTPPSTLTSGIKRAGTALRNPVFRAAMRWGAGTLPARFGQRNGVVDTSVITSERVRRGDEFWRAEGRRQTLIDLYRGGLNDMGSQTERLGELKGVPSIVMHGRHDRVIPFPSGEALAAAIGAQKLVIFEDAGHVPMEEIPERSAAEARAFMDGLGA
jgi:pimeloyl-ACP methyl ester carboxylesterase